MSDHFVIGFEGALTLEQAKAIQEYWKKMLEENPGHLAVLQSQDKERIEKLENLLRPFAEAYRLHKNDDRQVSELKSVMSMNTKVDHWRAAFVELYGEEKVAVEET